MSESKPLSAELTFFGMRVIANPYLPKTRREQFRFPRSKKVRIRKKWRKDLANWREVDCSRDVWLIGGEHYMTPEGFNELKNRPGSIAVVRNVGDVSR